MVLRITFSFLFSNLYFCKKCMNSAGIIFHDGGHFPFFPRQVICLSCHAVQNCFAELPKGLSHPLLMLCFIAEDISYVTCILKASSGMD